MPAYRLTSPINQIPRVTSGFKTKSRPTHRGLDIARPPAVGEALYHMRQTVKATLYRMPWEVNGFGNWVYIKCDDGFGIVVAHLDRFGVPDGARVDLNSIIGYMGATGRVTGAHAHIELHTQVPSERPTIQNIKWKSAVNFSFISRPKINAKPKPSPVNSEVVIRDEKIKELQNKNEQLIKEYENNLSQINNKYVGDINKLNQKIKDIEIQKLDADKQINQLKSKITELNSEAENNGIQIDGINPEFISLGFDLISEELKVNPKAQSLLQKINDFIDNYIKSKRLRGWIKYGIPLFLGGNLVAILTYLFGIVNINLVEINSLLAIATLLQQEIGVRYGGSDQKIDTSDIDRLIGN